jgi:hypothetical protein
MKYTMSVTDIVWDTDGEDVHLPSSLTVSVDADDCTSDEDINNLAAEAAEDKEGWCILSCNVSKKT